MLQGAVPFFEGPLLPGGVHATYYKIDGEFYRIYNDKLQRLGEAGWVRVPVKERQT